ncbi:hypothetical protein THS27_19455 [Thalassospira sp. MCCC 1A01428]|nr:hypothetical protein THS27_19455 [Thalassospira sp. MCCC 1A01428]
MAFCAVLHARLKLIQTAHIIGRFFYVRNHQLSSGNKARETSFLMPENFNICIKSKDFLAIK